MTDRSGEHARRFGLWEASIAALALLVLFMVIQRLYPSLLELDTKWVVVAAVPLIVAILMSDIIRRFKGFGIEFEMRLKDPIGQVNLVATDASTRLPGADKQSEEFLKSMNRMQKSEVRRLTFIQGRVGHYGVEAITRYLSEFCSLRFLEVQDEKGRFVALLRIGVFQDQQGRVYGNQLYRLVQALENRNVSSTFGGDAITESVRDEESLLTVLPKLRESKFGLLPVTSRNDRLLGIVTTEIVEKRIADTVIAAQRNA